MKTNRDFLYSRVMSPAMLGVLTLIIVPIATYKYHGFLSIIITILISAMFFVLAFWNWNKYKKEEREQELKDRKIVEMEAELRELKKNKKS